MHIPWLAIETAAHLMAKQLPPVTMVIEDLWPAGLYLLAGDPKLGKSMLVQDLALSVSTGTPAWGRYPVLQGDVLYLALEGGERALKDRFAKMLGSTPPPTSLDIAYESLGLRNGLEEQLALWLEAKPRPRLVIIDTYAAVAPEIRGVNRLREEYASLAGLAQLAIEWPDTLFLVVHHTRKNTDAANEDPQQRISGSTGLTAVTDGNAVLYRKIGSPQCVLMFRPRNAEEAELVLQRQPDLRWEVVGTDELAQLSVSRQQVLTWLIDHPDGGGPKQIAEALGATHDSMRKLLREMLQSRQIAQSGRGRYSSLQLGLGASST